MNYHETWFPTPFEDDKKNGEQRRSLCFPTLKPRIDKIVKTVSSSSLFFLRSIWQYMAHWFAPIMWLAVINLQIPNCGSQVLPANWYPWKKQEPLFTFHKRGVLNKSLKQCLVALIPKKEGASELSHYRPISLVGCVYKLLAKVLAAKLSSILGGLIGESQGAFIEGRQILNGVLIANELIHPRRKEGPGGVWSC